MVVSTISVASCWEPNANAMLLTILPLPCELTPRRRISSFWRQLCEGHNENCFNAQSVLNGFRRFIKIHLLSNLDKWFHIQFTQTQALLVLSCQPICPKKGTFSLLFLAKPSKVPVKNTKLYKQPGLYVREIHMATTSPWGHSCTDLTHSNRPQAIQSM